MSSRTAHEASPGGALLTPRQVCERLQVSRQTLAVWVRAGKMPAITLPSGHRRYRREDVEAIERTAEDCR